MNQSFKKYIFKLKKIINLKQIFLINLDNLIRQNLNTILNIIKYRHLKMFGFFLLKLENIIKKKIFKQKFKLYKKINYLSKKFNKY